MGSNKNGLDEMQKARRNSIGNQMFILMFYALLFDSGLYGAGIHWLKYPANVMVIIIACMGIYLVSTIAANAYLPPKAQNRKMVIALLITLAFSVVFAIAVSISRGNPPTRFTVEAANDNSALILLLVSAVGLLVSLLVAIIKKANDRNDGED